jgi:hypothetical protein
MPLYGHWFGLEIYNMYLSAKEQLQNDLPEIKLGNFSIAKSVLNECSKGLKKQCGLKDLPDMDGRGIMASSACRSQEITWTGFCQPHLQKLLFHRYSTGICVHQGPSRKRKRKGKPISGNPDMADWSVYQQVNYVPGFPVSFSDGKLVDIEHASRTSVCHSVNGIHCHKATPNWPLLISIPSLPDTTRLELHIPCVQGMWVLPIVSAFLWEKALLCAFYYAVHSLLAYKGTTKDPLAHNMPIFGGIPLKTEEGEKVRIFCVNNTTVHKYFDTTAKVYIPNYEIIRDYGNLHAVKLDNATTDGRIKVLTYEYIEGDHRPTSVSQFKGALTTLKVLHEAGFVHGDIRLANIIFTLDNSYLIDFDLSRKAGSIYPIGYAVLGERHKDARSGTVMLPEHDRHSMSKIMAMVDIKSDFYLRVADIDINLNTIIAEL